MSKPWIKQLRLLAIGKHTEEGRFKIQAPGLFPTRTVNIQP